jgi:hypothetical protein
MLKEDRTYPQRSFQILVGAFRIVLLLEKSQNGLQRMENESGSQKIYSIQACFLIKGFFIPCVIKGYCFPIIGGQKFYL